MRKVDAATLGRWAYAAPGKVASRLRPRVIARRALKGVWVSLLGLAIFFLAGSTFGTGDAITQISESQLYSVARWEVGNFLKKWTHAAQDLFGDEASSEEKVQAVRRYFALSEEINALAFRVKQAEDGFTAEPELPRLRQELLALRDQRSDLEPDVEETLEAMITSELKQVDVASSLFGLGFLWPPVDFRLDQVPKLLVVSRRDRIGTITTKLIKPDISLEDRDTLESTIDSRDLSSLILSIGGVATYPSLIPEGRSLKGALRLAAHEWTHHYLFFHPLGRGYNRNGSMTTLNETVADVVGDEIGDAVYRRFFATPEELAVVPPAASDPDPNRFDFTAFMRETRLEADGLLAEGRVEDAEASMERRRLELTDHGYFFRKINQAFFAFNGSYANRPGSVSPIGGQVSAVRAASATLGDFLSTVAGYASYESFERDVPKLASGG